MQVIAILVKDFLYVYILENLISTPPKHILDIQQEQTGLASHHLR